MVREFAPRARVVINVADLHFLRMIRDAIADGSNDKMTAALRTVKPNWLLSAGRSSFFHIAR